MVIPESVVVDKPKLTEPPCKIVVFPAAPVYARLAEPPTETSAFAAVENKAAETADTNRLDRGNKSCPLVLISEEVSTLRSK
jgi:hypothetical protein